MTTVASVMISLFELNFAWNFENNHVLLGLFNL